MRLCGMACLRMALIARDGHAPTLFTLLSGCLKAGGYVEHPDGSVTGLLYRPFADFTRDRYQLRACRRVPAWNSRQARSYISAGSVRS
jgi:hypothetical protein